MSLVVMPANEGSPCTACGEPKLERFAVPPGPQPSEVVLALALDTFRLCPKHMTDLIDLRRLPGRHDRGG